MDTKTAQLKPSGHSSGQMWHSAFASDVMIKRRRRTHTNKIRAIGLTDIAKSKNILDVACGEGEFLDLLTEMGYTSLTGIDLADLTGPARPGWKFVKGSATQMPFKDGEFDVIWCANSLHHLSKTEEIEKFLNETRRCLKPGGTLFLIDHFDSIQLRVAQGLIESPLGVMFPLTRALRTLLLEEHSELYHYLDHWKDNREVIRKLPFKVSRWNYKLFHFYYRAVKP